MVLPVCVYGNPVLRKKAEPIGYDYPDLEKILADLWETMYVADGVGLAAPQLGFSIRIFVIDTKEMADEDETIPRFKRAFINPVMVSPPEGEEWVMKEGCLSIPGFREEVKRPSIVKLKWQDENFKPFEESFDGMVARVIQHEYDHLEGILFPDRLTPLKRRLVKGRLTSISKGFFEADYRTVPNRK